MGPWRTTAIWGFWKATSPAEVVTVYTRMTLVASKFNLLTEAVTISMYHLSSSVWSDRTMGLVNSTSDAVVGSSWVMASIGLASWPVGQSSILGLIERTVVSPSGRGFTRPDWVCPTSSTVGKAIGLTSGVSSSGGVAPCVSQASAEFDPLPLMSVVVGWVMGCPWGTVGPQSTVSGAIFPRLQRMSYL